MNRRLIALSLLWLPLMQGFSQSVALTAADYQRATDMLRGNTSILVDNLINPVWTADNRIWYQSLTENASTFKMYNPADGKWITAPARAELFEKAGIKTEAATRRNLSGVLSPDGKLAAFIRDWNLWVKEVATGIETQVTTDGVQDFGYATDNAGWVHSDRPILLWSPDSKKIATYQQDQRHVSDMYLVKTKAGAPELMAWKYPLPEDSAIIKIHRVIVDLSGTPQVIRLQMAPDDRRSTLGDNIAEGGILMDAYWSADSKKLVFASTSRDHREEKVRMADTETGTVTEIFQETVATQFESGQDAICWSYLSGSDEIIWYSERSDWGHLYLYDARSGKLKNPVTSGAFVVREVVKVDEKNRTIYFIAGGKEPGNPYFRYLYKVGFDGKNLKLLTPEKGDHTVHFSPDEKYFTDSYSQPDVPPVYEVRNTSNGKLRATLEKTDVSRLAATGWKPMEPFTVKSADGEWDLYGLLGTPSQLDPSKKYPVIVYIYPGPQSGTISSWSFTPSQRDCQSLAELGFVVMMLNGSCNPQRSKSFHDACYGFMSTNTLPDQIAALEQLQKTHAFLDLDRVGIWGHSGGGFATAAAMFQFPDFFKVGIAESGNHDNRNYEDDWGERYIGLETYDATHKSNYEPQANETLAKNLKGNLLLIHGGMDDNVPPYNAYLVADALIKAHKDFDYLILPNARHGYGADSDYIMRRRWDYFVEHLLKGSWPKEFEIVMKEDPRLKK